MLVRGEVDALFASHRFPSCFKFAVTLNTWTLRARLHGTVYTESYVYVYVQDLRQMEVNVCVCFTKLVVNFDSGRTYK